MTEPIALATLVTWSLTLTEPLLSLKRRARLEDGLARAHVTDRELVELFLAGIVSDMVRTLPANDPWTELSARIGDVTVGQEPPGATGAVTAAGKPFGTWRDALDQTPLLHASPFDDPGLAALAGDDMVPEASAILAAGATGWRETAAMVAAAYAAGPSSPGDYSAITDIRTRETYARGAALHHTREAAVQAVRWAIHRRRAYVGSEDAWPSESAFRWAWRVTRQASGQKWSPDDVEHAIAAEQLRVPTSRRNAEVEDLF